MKLITRKYLSSLAATVMMSLSFASCSSDDLIVPGDESVNDGSGVYLELTVNVPLPSATTRVDNASESSETYNAGLTSESKVNYIYLYFFDEDGNVVKADGTNNYIKASASSSKSSYYGSYKHSDVDYSNPENGYESDTGKGVAYCTDVLYVRNLKVGKSYHVYVLCNHNLKTFDPNSLGTYPDLDFTTEDEFVNSKQSMQCISANGGYSGNVPMASRDYQGNIYQTITIEKSYETKTTPLRFSIQVERSLARITFTNTSNEFTLYKTTDYLSSQTYGTIKIVNREVLNNPQGWYTFRHVGTISSTFVPKFASGSSCFGKLTTTAPYVITPYTEQQTTTEGCYAGNDTPLVIVPGSKYYSSSKQHLFDWLTWVNTNGNGFEAYTTSTQGAIGMYAENSMAAVAQNRGNATAVILRGQLNLNTSCIADYSRVSNYGADEYQTVGSYYSQSYLYSYYFYDGKFYLKASNLASDYSELSGITKNNYQKYGVKKFKYGFGYYIYYVRHNNNNNSKTMGTMEFALVRNNSYDITIGKVALPPYTDDDINNLTTKDMIVDVEQAQTFLSGSTSVLSMGVLGTELPIGE